MLKTFKLLFVLCLVAVMGSNALGQTRYWVFFTDKKGVTLDSASFCNQFWAINGAEETDYPVSDQYISAVGSIAKSTGHTTRWFNAVAVEANSRQLKQIAKLPFVKDVRPTEGYFSVANHSASIMSNDEIVLDLAFRQTERMGGRYFRDSSITGKGVRIAIFDGGFPGVDKHEAFEHIRKENRIIATYDFTKNKTNVYHSNNHGTNVMSCIGGMYGDVPLGLAPDAEFLLAITEVAKEPFSEEENWLAAVEWAHRNGAKIINSSLGYTYHRYFTNQMDGRTSLVARAALLAARKGMLVVNAAGNEGTDEWRAIGTPADADSILTIGGVSPDTHLHID
ncbi:MAG TPA: S8 family serine peptidase, partial [Tenuifilaceae bacterium]|nr:S8 family serine peptidase [Tenuifilaceae bacterium]